MKEIEAIQYLEKLEVGSFLTVNIPIMRDDVAPVTVMYAGKDKDVRYNFIDSGNFKMSKDFIERGQVSIDKEYDGDKAIDIHSKFKMEQERKQNKKKCRDVR